MRRLVLAALLLGATAVSAKEAPDAATLTRMLKEFLAGASVNDSTAHQTFWADDLIYTGSSGRRTNKAEILKGIRESDPPKPGDPGTVFTAEDIRIQQYGTTAIVAFRLVGTTQDSGKVTVAHYLNSGTFLKRNGRWQVVNWQATRMPAAADTASARH